MRGKLGGDKPISMAEISENFDFKVTKNKIYVS